MAVAHARYDRLADTWWDEDACCTCCVADRRIAIEPKRDAGWRTGAEGR
jgi:hypothetical protein